jgi:hypothetical protein
MTSLQTVMRIVVRSSFDDLCLTSAPENGELSRAIDRHVAKLSREAAQRADASAYGCQTRG